MPTKAPRDFTTRPLSGLPSWPVLAIAGVQKGGKTYAAVQASASELVGRTFMVVLGENDPDEYGLIPGQRVELVEHGGTYRDVLDALAWAAAQPWPDADHPNLIILDGGTRLWDLLTDMAQEATYAAARRKAQRQGKAAPAEGDEVKITPDQWNVAANRWGNVIDVLVNDHQGPSIVTARLDLVMVMDAQGQPTKDKTWKVQGHKSLVFDVDGIIELREQAVPGKAAPAVLRGLRSMRFQGESADFPEGLPVDRLWREMGLGEGFGTRRHRKPDTLASIAAEAGPEEQRQQQDRQAEQPQERPRQQERPAPTPAPAQGQRVERPPQEAGQYIADRWEASVDEAALVRMYAEGKPWVGGMSWASRFASYEDFTERQTVTWRGRIVPLLEVFTARRWEHQNGAGGQGPQEPRGGPDAPAAPQGDAEPQNVQERPAQPSQPAGPSDAPPPWNTDEEPPPADDPRGGADDPWATPQHDGTADEVLGRAYPTEQGSVANLVHGLGEDTTVVDTEEPSTPAERVAAEHADELATRRAEREAAAREAAEDQRGAVGGTPGPTPPAEKGAGYAAFQEAKARAKAEADRIAQEDHPAPARAPRGSSSTQRKGKTT